MSTSWSLWFTFSFRILGLLTGSSVWPDAGSSVSGSALRSSDSSVSPVVGASSDSGAGSVDSASSGVSGASSGALTLPDQVEGSAKKSSPYFQPSGSMASSSSSVPGIINSSSVIAYLLSPMVRESDYLQSRPRIPKDPRSAFARYSALIAPCARAVFLAMLGRFSNPASMLPGSPACALSAESAPP